MSEPGRNDSVSAGPDMRTLLRDHDWAATPLGARAGWPPELRMAVDLMLDARHPALVGWGGDALVLYNDAYAALLGQRHPAVLGRPMREIWPALYPEVADQVAAALSGVPAHVEDHCVSLPWEGSAERWFSSSYAPLRDVGGAVLGLFHTAFETTGRVLAANRADQARRTSEARLSALFDSLPVGVALTDADGATLLSNHAMARYLPTGLIPSRDDQRHDRWRIFGADGGTVGRTGYPGARALRGERVVPGMEALYREDDGRETWAHIASVPIRDDDGAIAGQVSVITDIDKVKRIEEDMRRLAAEASDASRRKSEFLAVLAHELRNPMAPIRTGLEIMRLRADSPETIERVREMLERQTRQMTHLIDDLLDVARVTSGKIEIRKQLVDLNRVVASAVETSNPMILGARHALEVSMWDEALLLDIDPTRIAQVVGNLLTNAAKYTPAGGRIAVAVRKERDGGGSALVSVTDSGVGLASESQEEIFEMFNQVGRNMGLAQGGLGIGLALVRQLAALHGGSVTASSEGVGKGSTFVLRLPLGVQPCDSALDAAPAERRSAQRRTFRILVVDDNTDAAESLSLLLQLNAHEIRTATNGKDALLLAEEFRPDIAFLDIGMPGMTGYELALRLRQLAGLERLHIVAVTGWGSEEDQARSREAGIDHHFTKPIAAETVSRLLSQLG